MSVPVYPSELVPQLYSVDLRSRCFYILDEICIESLAPIVRGIIHLNEQEPTDMRPIKLYICSEGGDLFPTFALLDVMRLSKIPIHTVGIGDVSSAAILLLIAGHKRYATPSTWMMHHQSTSNASGTEMEIEVRAAAAAKVSKATYKIMERFTNKTARFWENAAKRKAEFWLDPKAMKEHGVIDEILEETVKEAPNVRPDDSSATA